MYRKYNTLKYTARSANRATTQKKTKKRREFQLSNEPVEYAQKLLQKWLCHHPRRRLPDMDTHNSDTRVITVPRNRGVVVCAQRLGVTEFFFLVLSLVILLFLRLVRFLCSHIASCGGCPPARTNNLEATFCVRARALVLIYFFWNYTPTHSEFGVVGVVASLSSRSRPTESTDRSAHLMRLSFSLTGNSGVFCRQRFRCRRASKIYIYISKRVHTRA